jgi:hypothetical protein
MKERPRIDGPYIIHTAAMLKSPAWRVMSLSGRKLLDRIEIEHTKHGGNDNGKLPATFNQFVEYGIHRHSIAPALREVSALGFIEVTEHGRAGGGDERRPNVFRLTYLPEGAAKPTNEWRFIKTVIEAQRIAKAARLDSKSPVPVFAKSPVPVSAKDQCRKMHRSQKITPFLGEYQGTESITTSRMLTTALPSLPSLSPLTALGDAHGRDWLTLSSSGGLS